MRLIVINTVGRRFEVEIDDALKGDLASLKRAVVSVVGLRLWGEDELQRVKLVTKGGKALTADEDVATLQNDDVLLAAVAPKPPPAHLQTLLNPVNNDEDESLFKVTLASTAPNWQHALVAFLRQKLRVPDILLALFYNVLTWKVWLGIVVWMGMVRMAAVYTDFGPVAVVSSIFILIGTIGFSSRKEGSLSGYSLFNPNLERLPGQITAEHLDGQLRRGQM